jgi:hypothetical protein
MIGWGGAAALLALPFIAMQFTRDVNWTLSDFIVFGAMILMVGIPLELVARASRSWYYRGGALLALAAAFLTVWANLAVGIVGSEDNPANLMFFGALLVGVAGTIATRVRAGGMAWAMVATAASLGVAFVIAASGPTDEPNVSHLIEAVGTGVFAALFLGSAALFRKASRA